MPNNDSSAKLIAGKGSGIDQKLKERATPLRPYSELVRSPDSVSKADLLGSGNVFHLANVFLKLGEKRSGTRPVAARKDLNVLRKKCLEERRLRKMLKKGGGPLFVDPAKFPAHPIQHSSDGLKKVEADTKWTRPPDMVEDPQFSVNEASRSNKKHGDCGDHWLVAAAAYFAMHNKIFNHGVPKNENSKKKYAVIFHFRFWQYGKWVDVVIGDRLLTYHDKDGNKQLSESHSAANNEFWRALLVKAFAKLYGSYSCSEERNVGDAVKDLTGRVIKRYFGDSVLPDLFDVLLEVCDTSAFMGSSFKKAEEDEGEEEDETEDNEGTKNMEVNEYDETEENEEGEDEDNGDAVDIEADEYEEIEENEEDEDEDNGDAEDVEADEYEETEENEEGEDEDNGDAVDIEADEYEEIEENEEGEDEDNGDAVDIEADEYEEIEENEEGEDEDNGDAEDIEADEYEEIEENEEDEDEDNGDAEDVEADEYEETEENEEGEDEDNGDAVDIEADEYEETE